MANDVFHPSQFMPLRGPQQPCGRLVTQAPSPKMVKAPVTEQCALVPAKVRYGLTTLNPRRLKFDRRDGNPVRTYGRNKRRHCQLKLEFETLQLYLVTRKLRD